MLVLLTIGCCGRPAAADAPQFPPDISTTKVGELTPDGFYNWEWDVFAGQQPALSHWVLIDLCDEVYGDIVAGSLYGGTNYEFGHDPTTGHDGLKFEVELDDLGHGQFGFNTHTQWEPGLYDVAFKSGQLVTFQEDVVGPSCDPVNPAPAPEPGSMALLGCGALGLLRRRLAARFPQLRRPTA